MLIGKIIKLRGVVEADAASITMEDSVCYLEISEIFNPVQYKLSGQIARIESGDEIYTSKSKLAARVALAGMAGSAWKSGSGGWAGMLGGLASSFGTTSRKNIILVTLMNGQSFTGETTPDVINYLESISPSLSDEQLIEVQKASEKLERYIADAPRTIHEVQKQIAELKTQSDTYKSVSENGESFDERDDARDKYFHTNNELAEKESLYKTLEERIKAVNKFGSFEKYETQRAELQNRLIKHSKKVRFPWISVLIVIALLYWTFTAVGDDKVVPIMLLVIFGIWPLIRFLRMPKNFKIIQHSEVQLENILN